MNFEELLVSPYLRAFVAIFRKQFLYFPLFNELQGWQVCSYRYLTFTMQLYATRHLFKLTSVGISLFQLSLRITITCNKHKQFLISYKMAVSFKLNNFDFAFYLFLLYLNLFALFLLRYHLLLHVGLLVMLVLFPINLSLIPPKSVMVLFVQVMSILVNLFVRVDLFA